MRNKNILGSFLSIMGFIGYIVIVILSTFDSTQYSGTNHFLGFISFYGLEIILVTFILMLLIGIIILAKIKK